MSDAPSRALPVEAELELRAEVERLKGELEEAGQYTEAHERLDDLARERVAAAEAELTEALFHRDLARARLTQAEAERDEARDGESRWLIRVHNIRYASGAGVKPMLAELPGAIAARIEAAEARATQAEEQLSASHAEAYRLSQECDAWVEKARAAEASLSRLKADVVGVLERATAFNSQELRDNGHSEEFVEHIAAPYRALLAKLKEAGSHDR